MLTCLETRRILCDKTLTQPLIVVAKLPECDADMAGFYCEPWPCEELIGGRYYDSRKGIIVISEDACNAPGELRMEYSGVLAHEFRHHWQRFNTKHYYDSPTNYREVGTNRTYQEIITEYFTTSLCELDALLFEYRVRPNDDTRQRYEWMLPTIMRRYGVELPFPLKCSL